MVSGVLAVKRYRHLSPRGQPGGREYRPESARRYPHRPLGALCANAVPARFTPHRRARPCETSGRKTKPPGHVPSGLRHLRLAAEFARRTSRLVSATLHKLAAEVELATREHERWIVQTESFYDARGLRVP